MALKRHPVLAVLSREHFTGLLLSQVLKTDTPRYRGMPETTEGRLEFLKGQTELHLKPHFEAEEKILFPFVKGRDRETDDLIDQLCGEHAQLLHLIGALDTAVHKDAGMDQIGHLLEKHIRTEERTLFELIQKHFSEEELQELGKILGPGRGD